MTNTVTLLHPGQFQDLSSRLSWMVSPPTWPFTGFSAGPPHPFLSTYCFPHSTLLFSSTLQLYYLYIMFSPNFSMSKAIYDSSSLPYTRNFSAPTPVAYALFFRYLPFQISERKSTLPSRFFFHPRNIMSSVVGLFRHWPPLGQAPTSGPVKCVRDVLG